MLFLLLPFVLSPVTFATGFPSSSELDSSELDFSFFAGAFVAGVTE